MKTAVLGIGKIFNKHFEAIRNLSNIKLVALCDKDENSYNQIKKLNN